MLTRTPRSMLSQQWRSPTDILSVLLLIGGDTVEKALAQLAGPNIVPVAFSFGWAAYAFSALMSAVGDGKLMPATDCPSIVINVQSGYVRDNNSWVLDRILRDLEDMHVVNRRTSALCVRVYVACDPKKTGLAQCLLRDWVWTMGVAVIFVQLGIAAIPWALHSNWSIFLVTAAGTTMALVCGALPQWRTEKWACRRNSDKTMALTRGNGSHFVAVVVGNGVGLNLEDLASGRVVSVRGTREVIAVLALLWLALLVTVSGLSIDTWYLMGIGLLGMIQNVVAAGASRTSENFDMPLRFLEEFSERKVMMTLQELEIKYPGIGASLLPVFFPGGLRKDESEWWESKKEARARTQGKDGGAQQQPVEVQSDTPPTGDCEGQRPLSYTRDQSV